MSRFRIGIDTGGTFTDVVAVDRDSGAVTTTKTPSTPADPSVGFLAGVRKVLAALGAPPDAVAALAHGTTVATNALLSEDFTGLGFVTTAGFRHVLEIARQSVPDGYGNSYFWVKPARIVPLHHVWEVPERLDPAGRVVRPFDETAAVAVARELAERGITAVGVCFLHAYANPEHERRMRAVLAREHPAAAVSISSEVLREYREYERSMTTLVDAYVKPTVSDYTARIAARIGELTGKRAVPFHVMTSNGGVISAAEVGDQPITTILSGPAAGALGAAYVATAAGFDPVFTLDGGGTSSDVAVLRAGEPALTTEGQVGRFPVKVPMVDVVTVGTGGGSIAWISPEGRLKVGPRSAGADPGPVCYQRGGAAATVTDAQLVLGRIPPHLLGGEIPLDRPAARAALEALGAAVGLDAEAAAEGVLEIAAWNQANAIRQATVRRGLDVRGFTMCAFGGSGPLQACRLVDLLDTPSALVPRDPGNLSAFGLLTVDVRVDAVRTFVARHTDLDPAGLAALAATYADLEGQVGAALDREGFDPPGRVLLRAADLRYFGQAFEVRVTAPGDPAATSAPGFAAEVAARFHDAFAARFGYHYRDDPRGVVEWVNLRVTGVGRLPRPVLPTVAEGTGDPSPARRGTRPVRFAGRWYDAPLFSRPLLRAGDVVVGPAVVEEFGSTTPLAPGFAARTDRFGNLVVTRSTGPAEREGR